MGSKGRRRCSRIRGGGWRRVGCVEIRADLYHADLWAREIARPRTSGPALTMETGQSALDQIGMARYLRLGVEQKKKEKPFSRARFSNR